ncbi:MAG: hypothetical protein JW722_05420 [Demequinaceae bacterium]|nr:hypothetical protein [Demequinaceae bacterium]
MEEVQVNCLDDGSEALDRHCATNDNSTTRTIPVASDAWVVPGREYSWVLENRTVVEGSGDPEDCGGGWDASAWELIQGWVWIYINDGVVTAVEIPYMGC